MAASGNSATVFLRAKDDGLNEQLKKAEESVQSFGGRVTKVLTSMGASILNPFALIGKSVSSVVKHIGGLIKTVKAYGDSALEYYEVQRQSEIKLASVMRATGSAAGFSIAQLKEMAASLQNITDTGDETWLSMMSILGTFKNIRGDAFKDALYYAKGMSEVFGTDLKSSVLQVGKALNDPIQGVTALRRAGVQLTQQQKALVASLVKTGNGAEAQKIILNELASEFGDAAKDLADPFEQLQNRIGDIYEKVGEAIRPIYLQIAEGVGVIVTGFESAMPMIQEFFGYLLEQGKATVEELRPYFFQFLDTLVGVFSAGQVVFDNFQESVDIALEGVRLGIVKVSENVKYFFTGVIPSYLGWLAENWTTVFVDIASYVGTVLSNMNENIKRFYLYVFDWLQGNQVSWRWVSLERGFKSTLSELPKIAEREKSSLERSLEESLSDAVNPLIGQWEKRMEENKDAFYKMFDKAKGTAFEDIQGEPSTEYDFGYGKKEDKSGKVSANFEDIQALSKRIAASAATSPEKLMLDEMKKAQKTREKIAEAVTKGNNKKEPFGITTEQLNIRDPWDKSGYSRAQDSLLNAFDKAIEEQKTYKSRPSKEAMDAFSGMQQPIADIIGKYKVNEGQGAVEKAYNEARAAGKTHEEAVAISDAVADNTKESAVHLKKIADTIEMVGALK